jgi:von Willebrand factor type A domain
LWLQLLARQGFGLFSMMPSDMELRDWCQWHRGGRLPAWLVSMTIHFAAFIALGLTARNAPQGAADAPTRMGGIVLVARTAGKPEYFSDEPGGTANDAVFVAPAAERPPAAQDPAPSAPAGIDLPSTEIMPAAGATALPLASMAAQGGSQIGPAGRGHAAAVETRVFGVRGRGTRFVYVFDRSSSMEGGPLIAAKRELIASLQSLESVHQFQIIFYNQEPQLMPLRSASPAMAFGNEPGKRVAASFVGSIYADGATDHMQALQMALRLRPDVIFFLTDADEPQLRSDDFQKIRRWNQGTSINAIEFGRGPPQARESFLQRLAVENGGQHSYVDITRLVR